MADYKKQHYVPNLYLRNFSSNRRLINLMTIKAGHKLTNVNLADHCYENYLYSDDGIIEALLSDKVEGPAGRVLDSIIQTEILPADQSEEILDLYNFILIHEGGTTAAAQAMEEQIEALGEELAKTHARSTGKFTEEQLKGVHLRINKPARHSLGISAMLLPMMIDLKPALLKNQHATGLITSDHPVVLLNPYLKPYRGDTGSVTGWVLRGLQVILPISPKLAVLLYDEAVYRLPKMDQNRTLELTETEVEVINSLQVLNAKDKIFFHDPSQLKAVEETIEEHAKNRQTERTKSGKINVVGAGEVFHTQRADIAFGEHLTFTEIIPDEKRDELHSKTPLTPRIPQLMEMQSAFWKQVHAQRYKPNEFEKFMRDMKREIENEKGRNALVGPIETLL